MHCTYKESFESPLLPDNIVLDETIGTAWYSVDGIVAAHDTGSLALTHAGLKCREVSLHHFYNYLSVTQRWFNSNSCQDFFLPQQNPDRIQLHWNGVCPFHSSFPNLHTHTHNNMLVNRGKMSAHAQCVSAAKPYESGTVDISAFLRYFYVRQESVFGCMLYSPLDSSNSAAGQQYWAVRAL